MAIVTIILFIFARFIAMLAVMVGGFIINKLVSWFAKKDDIESAKMIVAYASIASLIANIPKLDMLSPFVWIVIVTIGISARYHLKIAISLLIALIPQIILGAIGLWIGKGLT